MMTLRATLPVFIASNPSLISSSLMRATHQLVELEPALHVHVDVARHVDAEPVRAHVRALSFFSNSSSTPGISTLSPTGIIPMTDRGAALAKHAERLLGRGRQADGLERVVHPASGQLLDLRHRVAV